MTCRRFRISLQALQKLDFQLSDVSVNDTDPMHPTQGLVVYRGTCCCRAGPVLISWRWRTFLSEGRFLPGLDAIGAWNIYRVCPPDELALRVVDLDGEAVTLMDETVDEYQRTATERELDRALEVILDRKVDWCRDVQRALDNMLRGTS